jgi:hypothetical protein
MCLIITGHLHLQRVLEVPNIVLSTSMAASFWARIMCPSMINTRGRCSRFRSLMLSRVIVDSHSGSSTSAGQLPIAGEEATLLRHNHLKPQVFPSLPLFLTDDLHRYSIKHPPVIAKVIVTSVLARFLHVETPDDPLTLRD